MVGEAGRAVEAHGSPGSLDLVITGKWEPRCAFGNECLLSRRVASQGPKPEAPVSCLFPMLCLPSRGTVLLAPSNSPFC